MDDWLGVGEKQVDLEVVDSSVMGRSGMLVGLIAAAMVIGQLRGQSPDDSVAFFPATGDLMLGRGDQLKASSTCGMNGPEHFCVVSDYHSGAENCYICDNSVEGQRHPIQDVIAHEGSKWWQAANGVQNVTIELNLFAEFYVTHIILRFKTFRPRAMKVSRSLDFGKSWSVHAYYSDNCTRDFPHVKVSEITDLNDTVRCTQKYSGIVPSQGGEVIYRALPSFINLNTVRNPYNKAIQNLLKTTDIKLEFVRLWTLGDQDFSVEVNQKYYYAVQEMVVRGMCSCYGHARQCPVDNSLGNLDDEKLRLMVSGNCSCEHNTEGKNCEKCREFYNRKPWGAAYKGHIPVCEKCRCNGHATKCHFDAAVYQQSGKVDGGVCDECQDNTDGIHCDSCKEFFYENPNARVTDKNFCKECECEYGGTKGHGRCYKKGDKEKGIEAGQCFCKDNVQGRRCDQCKDGFFNITEENVLGCEPCDCHIPGTVDVGCDKKTGACKCKRNVEGPRCDTCAPQTFNLSQESETGCTPCDCDPGGAYDNNCDVITGQCKCRPNVAGRRCNMPAKGFFYERPWLMWEGEDAEPIDGGCTVPPCAKVYEVLPEVPAGSVPYFTGRGFMGVLPGGGLNFSFWGLPASLNYRLMVRYQGNPEWGGRDWDQAVYEVVRDRDVSLGGGDCHNYIPTNDQGILELPANDYPTSKEQRQICFEKDKRYNVILRFNNPRNIGDNVPILIDHIALLPDIADVKSRFGNPDDPRLPALFQRYQQQNCEQYIVEFGINNEAIPDECLRAIFSIYTLINNGTRPCDCDPIGSRNETCEKFQGQCQCYPNVGGRRCDYCKRNFWGMDREQGCKPCECDPLGTLEYTACDTRSGQCHCRTDRITERQCDQCKAGFFNFPHCDPCQCNGWALQCEDVGGRCIDCQGNTEGANCEVCKKHFYGEPAGSPSVACKPCQCPFTQGNAYHATAHGCFPLADVDQKHNCWCDPGFSGDHCQECASGYFGQPLAANGTCQPCPCNGNIDTSDPDACDERTGVCLKCLHNTAGETCNECADKFYGDAFKKDCRPCQCRPEGVDKFRTMCDLDDGQCICEKRSGSCECLPNVEAPFCQQCSDGYWNLTANVGCVKCDCDFAGSVNNTCDQSTGQCFCKEGYGGRRCNQCPDEFYGDRLAGECKPCACHINGSQHNNCDKDTGACVCQEGITGRPCDMCDRGTTGQLPVCTPCGECFDQWERRLDELKTVVDSLLNQNVSGVKPVVGKDQVDKLRNQVRELEELIDFYRKNMKIIQNMNRTVIPSQELKVERLEEDLDEITRLSDGHFTDSLGASTEAVAGVSAILTNIRTLLAHLRSRAEELGLGSAGGAYDRVLSAEQESNEARRRVDKTLIDVENSEMVRDETDQFLIKNNDSHVETVGKTREAIDTTEADLSDLSLLVGNISSKLCGGDEQQCDGNCGGLGCKVCANSGACNSYITKLDSLDEWATEFSKTAGDKRERVSKLQRDLSELDSKVGEDANTLRQRVINALNDLQQRTKDLIRVQNTTRDKLMEIEDFERQLNDSYSLVMSQTIDLDAETLAQKRNEILEQFQGITGLEGILNSTELNFTNAKALLARAELVRDDAVEFAKKVDDILANLAKAEESQAAAEDSATTAENDINETKEKLAQVDAKVNTTRATVDDIKGKILALKALVDAYASKMVSAKKDLETAGDHLNWTDSQLKTGAEKLELIKEKYAKFTAAVPTQSGGSSGNERLKVLEAKAKALKDSYAEAQKLLEKASSDELVVKLNELNGKYKDLLADARALADKFKSLGTGHTQYFTCSAGPP